MYTCTCSFITLSVHVVAVRLVGSRGHHVGRVQIGLGNTVSLSYSCMIDQFESIRSGDMGQCVW